MANVFNLSLSDGQQYPYQIVHSKRAKYIRIKLSQQGDLSVTLPAFTKVDLAHDFIRSKKIWIEKNLLKVTVQATNVLPQTLNLRLIEESWTVLYTETQEFFKTDLKLTLPIRSTSPSKGHLRSRPRRQGLFLSITRIDSNATTASW